MRDAEPATSTLDKVEVVQFMLRHQRAFSGCIAILGAPVKSHNGSFFEDFARNRGLDVRVFDSFEEALRWLMRMDGLGKRAAG
jgi:hypothetical protein